MTPARYRGLSEVDIEAIVERLDRHGEVLRDIKDTLTRVNDRISCIEKWQAGVDPVLDSIIERANDAWDKVEGHQTYIDQEKGGAAMKLQLISGVVTFIGLIVMFVKLLFFHS